MLFNMSEDDFDSVIAVHLKGTFNLCRHAAAYWREEHKKGNVLNGRIINTASDAGLLGNVGQTNYGACKAAVALRPKCTSSSVFSIRSRFKCLSPICGLHSPHLIYVMTSQAPMIETFRLSQPEEPHPW
jgi:NADP-dependent 3-hydroxy acid dehydrogenase YdfG